MTEEPLQNQQYVLPASYVLPERITARCLWPEVEGRGHLLSCQTIRFCCPNSHCFALCDMECPLQDFYEKLNSA